MFETIGVHRGFPALKECLQGIFSMPEKHRFSRAGLEPLKNGALRESVKLNIHF
ncbi:hypothetical protein [Pseudomonas gingeri]|uniref:Uncharacterized protein n=1 Tax=Pseudomonas gingeri TaxID=117681 RepID=A0A7Y8CHZ2_9PSED|nr:hypothetical protein [Pseudomonas gingeri]NWB31790.1 hypothetical protein [Pseudomonas gingeri]NWC30920.1 hypothetical protein [Pseudomonas gingeri]NWD46674.1 hypothetical protein [Pseudomonas gingeri]